MHQDNLSRAALEAVRRLLTLTSDVERTLARNRAAGSVEQLARLLVAARVCAADLDDAGRRRFSDGSAVRLTRRPGAAGGPARRRLVGGRPAGKIQDLRPGRR
jgi:hypothetical protein